jgi:hypothetical protein
MRYPEDLFRVQSDQYLLYHITDPRQFFNRVDPWEIARDPSNAERPTLRNRDTSSRPMLPYYLLMSLPDEQDLSFIIMQPFTPAERPNMVSFLIAKSDPGAYGQMIEYRLPAATQLDGPGQVGDLINQNPDISAEFTLLGQGGSNVIQGSMLVLPIEQSILYVQPIYIRADSADSSSSPASTPGFAAPPTQTTQSGIPEFKRVVVSYNGDIEMRATLAETLDSIFGVSDTAQPPSGGSTTEVPQEVASLVDAAEQALADANTALLSGDLGTYADKVAEAQGYVQRAADIIAGQPGTSSAGG